MRAAEVWNCEPTDWCRLDSAGVVGGIDRDVSIALDEDARGEVVGRIEYRRLYHHRTIVGARDRYRHLSSARRCSVPVDRHMQPLFIWQIGRASCREGVECRIG